MAVQGQGKAVEGQRKAVEGQGKALKRQGKAVEGQWKAKGKAAKGQGKARQEGSDERNLLRRLGLRRRRVPRFRHDDPRPLDDLVQVGTPHDGQGLRQRLRERRRGPVSWVRTQVGWCWQGRF